MNERGLSTLTHTHKKIEEEPTDSAALRGRHIGDGHGIVDAVGAPLLAGGLRKGAGLYQDARPLQAAHGHQEEGHEKGFCSSSSSSCSCSCSLLFLWCVVRVWHRPVLKEPGVAVRLPVVGAHLHKETRKGARPAPILVQARILWDSRHDLLQAVPPHSAPAAWEAGESE